MLIRLNQIMRGWANYFKHAVYKHTLHSLAHFVWWRVVQWLRTLHRWRWKDVRRRLTTPDGATDHGRRDRVVQPPASVVSRVAASDGRNFARPGNRCLWTASWSHRGSRSRVE